MAEISDMRGRACAILLPQVVPKFCNTEVESRLHRALEKIIFTLNLHMGPEVRPLDIGPFMYSKRVLVSLALIFVIAGGLAIINGLDIVQFERGWTQIIAGATALSAGLITYALAAVIHALESQPLRDAPVSVPADLNVPAPIRPEPMVTPASVAQPTISENAFELAVARATLDLDNAESNESKTPPPVAPPAPPALAPASIPAATPSVPTPKMAVLKSDTALSSSQEDSTLPPLPHLPLDMPAPSPKASLEERLPWKRKKNQDAQIQNAHLQPPLPPIPPLPVAPPMPAYTELTEASDERMAPDVNLESTPRLFDDLPPVTDLPNPSIPVAARPKLGELFRKATRPVDKSEDTSSLAQPDAPALTSQAPTSPAPLPPFPPGYSPAHIKKPPLQPFAPLNDQWKTSDLERSPWNRAEAETIQTQAPAVSLAPEESQAHQDYQPIDVAMSYSMPRIEPHFDMPQAAPEAIAPAAPEVVTEALPEPHIAGRYEANGTHYVLYSDGSIEADTGAGVYRFASITELKAFIDERETHRS